MIDSCCTRRSFLVAVAAAIGEARWAAAARLARPEQGLLPRAIERIYLDIPCPTPAADGFLVDTLASALQAFTLGVPDTVSSLGGCGDAPGLLTIPCSLTLEYAGGPVLTLVLSQHIYRERVTVHGEGRTTRFASLRDVTKSRRFRRKSELDAEKTLTLLSEQATRG